MPDEPAAAITQDLGNAEHDAERWARVHDDRGAAPDKGAPMVSDKPKVGLSRNGEGEGAGPTSEDVISKAAARTSPPPSAADLPAALVGAVQPWIDVVEAATAGMGQDVMRVAAEAVMGLRRRVVMTPDLERVIADARLASDELGICLDRDGFDLSRPRAEALAALEAEIELLRQAQLNE